MPTDDRAARARAKAEAVRVDAEQRRAAAEVRALEIRLRAFDTVARMRERNESLTTAARKSLTTPESVRRQVGEVLSKNGSRWAVSPSDRLSARMAMLTDEGMVNVVARSSRQRSLIGRHWAAVRTYQTTGNAEPLRQFATTSIGGHRFATDLDRIERWSRTSEIDLDDIYTLAN